MSVKAKKNNLYKEWIRKAQEDELSLRVILKGKGSPSTACFLSQQMAEKYLKSFLTYHEQEFPKIHHLERLLDMCQGIQESFKDLRKEAVLLSEYYIETRYPGDFPEFSWKDAKIGYVAAQRIKE